MNEIAKENRKNYVTAALENYLRDNKKRLIDVAEQLQVSAAFVSMLKSGKKNINNELLTKIEGITRYKYVDFNPDLVNDKEKYNKTVPKNNAQSFDFLIDYISDLKKDKNQLHGIINDLTTAIKDNASNTEKLNTIINILTQVKKQP